MNIFGHDIGFWIGLFVAAGVKVISSPFHSWWRAAVMVAVSVSMAWLFTDAAVDFFHLNPQIYKVPVGALITLTADGLVRLLFHYSSNPGELADVWNKFRGGGGKK